MLKKTHSIHNIKIKNKDYLEIHKILIFLIHKFKLDLFLSIFYFTHFNGLHHCVISFAIPSLSPF